MDVPSVTVLILVNTGSRYETKKQAGISHFLEHMMFKGTKNRPTALEIAKEIDGIGGAFNAYTSKDHTGYFVKATAEHTKKIVDILSDMTLHSLLSQEEIDREKGVIVEEMNMYEDTPMRKVGEVYEQLLYGDTPLGRDIIGTKKTVTSFKRKDFASYMGSFYKPNNALVIAAGGITTNGNGGHEGVVNMVDSAFSSWKPADTSAHESQDDTQSKSLVSIVRKKTEQTHICLGTRAFGLTDPRRYALGVMSVILGGGMSSRLFHEVRERRGLAYYVRSGTEKYIDVGYFVTQAGVPIGKATEAVSVMKDEYMKMTNTNEISDEDMHKAKSYMKGHMMLSLEDSQTVAGMFGTSLLVEGSYRTLADIIARIDAVTKEDVANVAADIFKKGSLSFAAIGPFEKGIEEKIEKIIAL